MKKSVSLLFLLLIAAVTYGQDGRDSFSIPWPAKYKWKKYDRATGTELDAEKERNLKYTWKDIKLFPEKETNNGWTIMASVSKYSQTEEDEIDLIEKRVFTEERKISSKAKLTLLEQRERWIIFKTESPAQSKLFLVMKGAWGNIWVASVTIKKAFLSKEFAAEWTKIFKAYNYTYW